jgi:hypothetical protein
VAGSEVPTSARVTARGPPVDPVRGLRRLPGTLDRPIVSATRSWFSAGRWQPKRGPCFRWLLFWAAKSPRPLEGANTVLVLRARCRVPRPAFHQRDERSSAPSQKSGLSAIGCDSGTANCCSRRITFLSCSGRDGVAAEVVRGLQAQRSERARYIYIVYMCAPPVPFITNPQRGAWLGAPCEAGEAIANSDILFPVLRLWGPKPDQRLLSLAREMRAVR